MFLWMTPMPPSCAMAMAMRASVTVSMAADSSGMLSRMFAGQPGGQVDVPGEHLRVGRDQQHVIESQSLRPELGVHDPDLRLSLVLGI